MKTKYYDRDQVDQALAGLGIPPERRTRSVANAIAKSGGAIRLSSDGGIEIKQAILTRPETQRSVAQIQQARVLRSLLSARSNGPVTTTNWEHAALSTNGRSL